MVNLCATLRMLKLVNNYQGGWRHFCLHCDLPAACLQYLPLNIIILLLQPRHGKTKNDCKLVAAAGRCSRVYLRTFFNGFTDFPKFWSTSLHSVTIIHTRFSYRIEIRNVKPNTIDVIVVLELCLTLKTVWSGEAIK